MHEKEKGNGEFLLNPIIAVNIQYCSPAFINDCQFLRCHFFFDTLSHLFFDNSVWHYQVLQNHHWTYINKEYIFLF